MMPSLQCSSPELIKRRIARILATLQHTLDRTPLKPDDIHEIRVDCKRLRGYLRLLRQTDLGLRWSKPDRQLRKLARSYRLARDQDVMQDTIRHLMNSSRRPRLVAACRETLASLQHGNHPTVPAGDGLLPVTLVTRLIGAPPTSEAQWQAALHTTYQRSLQLAGKALARPDATERWHKLRKWVKYLEYQLALVTLATPARNLYRQRLTMLGKLLGRIHDLVVLEQHLASFDNPATIMVATAAMRLGRQLTARADKQVRRLFAVP